MKLLIKNGIIIPMAPSLHLAPLNMGSPGSIAVDGEQIIHVGSVPESFVPDRIIDASGKIVMPGLVNAHTHLSMGLLRNYADDLDLFTWLNEKIWPVEAHLREEDVYTGSLLGVLELIRSGVTAFADMYFFQQPTCRAVEEAGIRANIGATFFGDIRETEARLSDHERLHQVWNGAGNGRILIDTAPHSIYTCTSETLAAALEFSHVKNNRIHIHLSETRRENSDSRKAHGLSPTAYIEELGMLERPVYAAHCVHLDPGDMDILLRHNVIPVHNPSSNLKLGSGFAPVPEMFSRGLQPALGTDGASSNNNLNMMEELHIASLIHKGISGDPTVVSAYETLKMATISGARALGIDHLCGTIEPGKQADIIIIDTGTAHMQPLHDPISAVVYSAQAADVQTVLCAGKILMEDRRLMTIDEEKILRMAAAQGASLISRSRS